jgi:hypothetical protein
MPSVRLAVFLALALCGWGGMLFRLYDGAPGAFAWRCLFLPLALGVAAVWVFCAVRHLKGPPPAVLVLLLAGMAAAAVAGAARLRQQQAVAPEDLGRITLDRRADPTGTRPRSNLRFRTGSHRSVELFGQLLNDNDFPVWEVTAMIRFFKDDRVWEYPVIFRVDLPAHGDGTVAWAKRFPLEAFPTEPSWEVQVLAARRHWGGGQPR